MSKVIMMCGVCGNRKLYKKIIEKTGGSVELVLWKKSSALRRRTYFRPNHLYPTYLSVLNFLCTCILAKGKANKTFHLNHSNSLIITLRHTSHFVP